MTFRRPPRCSTLQTSNDAIEHPCCPLVPFSSRSEYARTRRAAEPMNPRGVCRIRGLQPGKPGQSHRGATRTVSKVTIETLRLRSHTETARSRNPFHQDIVRIRATLHRAWVAGKCTRDVAAANADPGAPFDRSLAAGHLAPYRSDASPRHRSKLQIDGDLRRLARRHDRSRLCSREPVFDAPERPVGLHPGHVQPLVSPPGAVRSRYPDVGGMLRRCRPSRALASERTAPLRSRALLDFIGCDPAARNRKMSLGGPALRVSMSPSTVSSDQLLFFEASHARRVSPPGGWVWPPPPTSREGDR